MTIPFLSVRGLSFGYGRAAVAPPVLSNVSLDIERRSVVGPEHLEGVLDSKASAPLDEAALGARLDAMMPRVRVDLDELARNADKVEPAFKAIQARAFATELGYDRYLWRPNS